MAGVTAGAAAQGRRSLGARISAAVLLSLSLAAAVQAHLDERAAIARVYLEQANNAPEEDTRLRAKQAAADELDQWSGTGELRDLAALAALTEPNIAPSDAVQWAQAALRRNPANGETWARLAFAVTELNDEVNAEAAAALSNSFVVTPYGSSELLRDRLEFVMTHWDEVAPSDQRSALRQIPPLLEVPADRSWLEELSKRVGDSEGRQELEEALSSSAS